MIRFNRRWILGVVTMSPIACFLGVRSAAAGSDDANCGNAAIIGLAAPTAPKGASGGPIYGPEGNAWLGRSSRVEIYDFIDDSKSERLLRTDDGWYWGIPIKDIQSVGGDMSVFFNDFPR